MQLATSTSLNSQSDRPTESINCQRVIATTTTTTTVMDLIIYFLVKHKSTFQIVSIVSTHLVTDPRAYLLWTTHACRTQNSSATAGSSQLSMIFDIFIDCAIIVTHVATQGNKNEKDE
jgi:hypothetical protein